MAGSFLDTTVVVDLGTPSSPGHTKAISLVSANQPSLVAEYAYRELLAGPVQILCDAHNRVLAAPSPAAAIASVLKGAAFAGRTSTAKAHAIATALHAALSATGTFSANDVRRDVLQSLMLCATRLWHRAQAPQGVTRTQTLACASRGPLAIDPSTKALRGPGNEFNCSRVQRCSAARHMAQHAADVAKAVNALHPSNLGDGLKGKQETTSRRKALKELQQAGPESFNKRYCRALGDAYFAIMCPPGHAVATTNTSDFDPLCAALGKSIITP